MPQALLPPGASRPLYRFSVEQYDRMAELGILRPTDRAELIDGWVVTRMPHDPPHATVIDLLRDALSRLLPPEWRLREQKPIRTLDSRPEPVLVVVRGPIRRYASEHPGPGDIALVIEVADSSLADDRSYQGRVYARARLSIYWIVNIGAETLEVYTQPRAGKSPLYRRRQDYGREDRVPLVINGEEMGRIAVRDFLPS